MNRTYGYVRVSSKEQNEERQVKALLENGVIIKSLDRFSRSYKDIIEE